MTALFLLAATLLPGLGLTRVSTPSLTRLRDSILVAGWILGTAALGWQEPWLGVLGAYLGWWWLQPAFLDPLRRERWEKVPTLLTWAGIAGTWLVGRALPDWAWGWLPWLWGGWAWVASGVMVWQAWGRDWAKVKGWWGSRTVAGAFLALVLPLLPWWAWPGPLVGLWCSGPSWLAVAALGVSVVVLVPDLRLWGLLGVASVLLGLAVGLRWQVFGRAVGEWAPRGDTLDSLRHRLALYRLALTEWRILGTGPGTTNLLCLRAYCRGRLADATGVLHSEPLQLALEYGVAGVAGVVLFALRVAPNLSLGDPWSAVVMAGAVLSLGTMALRAAPLGMIWLLACAAVMR